MNIKSVFNLPAISQTADLELGQEKYCYGWNLVTVQRLSMTSKRSEFRLAT